VRWIATLRNVGDDEYRLQTACRRTLSASPTTEGAQMKNTVLWILQIVLAVAAGIVVWGRVGPYAF
jgi:hypothetical protein